MFCDCIRIQGPYPVDTASTCTIVHVVKKASLTAGLTRDGRQRSDGRGQSQARERSGRASISRPTRRGTGTGSSTIDGEVATLTMDVDEKGGLYEGYELKLNSYDLGVDIELADVLQRLRFEHPDVKVILLRSGKPRVFCAGANIRMLAGATHADKVNFCKFTNETRNGIEDSSENSGQKTIAVVTGSCAGGGYELALAADHIMLVDDGSSAVVAARIAAARRAARHRRAHPRHRQAQSAPRPCRRVLHHRGRRAGQARGGMAAGRRSGAEQQAGRDREGARAGIREEIRSSGRRARASSSRRCNANSPTRRHRVLDRCRSPIDRAARTATITMRGPDSAAAGECRRRCTKQGAEFWPLRLARELDDAILDIRTNELELAVIVFKSSGDIEQVLAYDALPRSGQRSLARARNPLLLEARAQAHRRDLALASSP